MEINAHSRNCQLTDSIVPAACIVCEAFKYLENTRFSKPIIDCRCITSINSVITSNLITIRMVLLKFKSRRLSIEYSSLIKDLFTQIFRECCLFVL